MDSAPDPLRFRRAHSPVILCSSVLVSFCSKLHILPHWKAYNGPKTSIAAGKTSTQNFSWLGD